MTRRSASRSKTVASAWYFADFAVLRFLPQRSTSQLMLPPPDAALVACVRCPPDCVYVREADPLALTEGESGAAATLAGARSSSIRCSAASRSRFCASAMSISWSSSVLPSSSQNGPVCALDRMAIPEASFQPCGMSIFGRANCGARLQAESATERAMAASGNCLRIGLLRSQSYDRIEARGLARRQIAENEPGRRRTGERQQRGGGGENDCHPAVAERESRAR